MKITINEDCFEKLNALIDGIRELSEPAEIAFNKQNAINLKPAIDKVIKEFKKAEKLLKDIYEYAKEEYNIYDNKYTEEVQHLVDTTIGLYIVFTNENVKTHARVHRIMNIKHNKKDNELVLFNQYEAKICTFSIAAFKDFANGKTYTNLNGDTVRLFDSLSK